MGINIYYRYIRYAFRGRADGERGREEREVIIINSIEVIIAIAIYIPPLIALYYIWELVL